MEENALNHQLFDIVRMCAVIFLLQKKTIDFVSDYKYLKSSLNFYFKREKETDIESEQSPPIPANEARKVRKI